MILTILITLFILLLGIVGYILMVIGLQKMAANREIEYSWLAWIPIGNVYIIGEVASYKNDGTEGLKVLIITIGAIILSFIPIFSVVASIGLVIYQMFLFYKIYDKYTNNSVLHLILGIFIPFYNQVLIFLKRNEEPSNIS